MTVAEQITKLEAILDSGTRQVTTDGLTVAYDLEEVRRRLTQLKQQQSPNTRPRLASIDLSNF